MQFHRVFFGRLHLPCPICGMGAPAGETVELAPDAATGEETLAALALAPIPTIAE